MTHHSIVCRLGTSDTGAVGPVVAGSDVTNVQLLDSFDRDLVAGLGQALFELCALGLRASEIAIDLAIVGAAVTAADTRVNRGSEADDHWTRDLHLYIPVSNAGLWETQVPLLRTTLNFLTGDRWTLHFRPRPPGRDVLSPQPEVLQNTFPTKVCLFSGGLDSFIGAIDLLTDGEVPLLVSHYWDGNDSKHQGLCSEALKSEYGSGRFQQIYARVGFDTNLVAEKMREDTLRARSFMFFSLAALAASSIGGTSVMIHVPENGLISLNVPLDTLRVGALSTRTTHPFYMARFNELLRNLGIAAELHNPYRFQTKGQMVDGCKNKPFLAQKAKLTISCSSMGKNRWLKDKSKNKRMHCGYCWPCLIRRAAMQRGLGSDDTQYYIPSLQAGVLNTLRAEGETIRSVQLALARYHAKPSRAELDIHKPGPLIDHPDDLGRYRGVYVTGMLEVEQLLSQVRAEPK